MTGPSCMQNHLGADHCRKYMGESSNHPTPILHGSQRAPAYRRLEASNKFSNNAGIQTKLSRALLQAQVAKTGQASNITKIMQKKFRDQFHSPFEGRNQTKIRNKALRRVSPQHIQLPKVSQGARQTATERFNFNNA